MADLARVAATMVDGVRARRAEWGSTETDGALDGVGIRSIEWSGLGEVLVDRGGRQARMRMSGIMIVGIKGPLVFALHTQDVEPFATKANPIAERAMRTFTLGPQ